MLKAMLTGLCFFFHICRSQLNKLSSVTDPAQSTRSNNSMITVLQLFFCAPVVQHGQIFDVLNGCWDVIRHPKCGIGCQLL